MKIFALFYKHASLGTSLHPGLLGHIFKLDFQKNVRIIGHPLLGWCDVFDIQTNFYICAVCQIILNYNNCCCKIEVNRSCHIDFFFSQFHLPKNQH